MAIDKRKALQPVLDSIEKGWQITKPSPLNPNDLETECIFQPMNTRDTNRSGVQSIRAWIESATYRIFKTKSIW